MTDGCSCTRIEADECITRIGTGFPADCPNLYVIPGKATGVHEKILERLSDGKWGFLLVQGENRGGKTAYLRELERAAVDERYAIVHIELDEEQIKRLGPNKYINKVIFENLRIGRGEIFHFKLASDGRYRAKVHQVIDSNYADFEFWSPSLTTALYNATSSESDDKRHLAMSWLRGEDFYIPDLREFGILDRTARSILHIPSNVILYFFVELFKRLDHRGTVVCIDEVERVATLTPIKGKETLNTLRNLINILVAQDALPQKRGIVDGLFMVFAVSTFYLGYSGILEVEGVDFKAQADRFGRPKVVLADIPRLYGVLKHNPFTIPVDFEAVEDLRSVAERILPHWEKARGKKGPVSAEELARAAFDETGAYTAGPNIQAMVKALES